VLVRFADGMREPVTVVENFWTSSAVIVVLGVVCVGCTCAFATGATTPTMAPAPNACSIASGSFFLFTFNMEPPMESLDNYNSIGRNAQFTL
jgi:hypothetical protein